MKSSLFGLSVLVGLPCSFAALPSAWAGDFNNPQRTYVPESLIQRRYDSDSAGQTNWGANPNNSGNYPQSRGAEPNSGSLSATAIVNAIDTANNQQSLSLAFGRGKKALEKLIEKGKWDDAEKVATKLLKVNPKDQEVRDKLTQIFVAQARIAYGKPDLETAARKARLALVTEQTNQPAKLILCQVFTKKGWNFQSAKEHLKLADGLASQSKFAEANAEYHLALGIKPSAAGHIGLGNILVSQGQAEEAAKQYAAAIQVDPKSSIAYRQLGSLRLAVHDLAGANRDLSQAVTLNPNDELASSELIQLWQQQVSGNLNAVNGHLGLARAYLITGNLEAAQTEYREVAKMEPNNPQLPPARIAFKAALAKRESQKCVAVAKTLNSQGAYRDARDKLLEAMSYSPATPEVLLLNGQVCEKLGLYEEAHEAYMSVLKADPNNIAAAQHLKTLPVRTNSALPPGKSTVAPPLAPSRSAASAPASSLPRIDASVGAGFSAVSTQNTPVIPVSSSPQTNVQVDDPLARLFCDTPSGLVAATPANNPLASSDQSSATPLVPAGSFSTPPATVPVTLAPETPIPATVPVTLTPETPTPATVAPATPMQPAPVTPPTVPPAGGIPSSSLAVPAGIGTGLMAPEGAETLGHTSTLTTFFNSFKNLSGNQQQPTAYAAYGSSAGINGAGYMMPGNFAGGAYPIGAQIPAINVGTPMMQGNANSSSTNQSLMSFLASPLASKLGFQPAASNDQQSQLMNVAVPQVVQGANGALYVVPTAVPMAVYGQPDQGNPLWNDLTNSKAGKKFHLAQVTQVGSGAGSVLSNIKVPPLRMRRNQSADAAAPTLLQLPNTQVPQSVMNAQSPINLQVDPSAQNQLGQVKDWDTGSNSEADGISPTATGEMETSSTSDMNTSSSAAPTSAESPEPAPTEVALRPAMGTLSLSTSLAHAVTLQIASVKHSLTGARVKVVLKNNSGKSVNISEQQKIAFQIEDKPEQLLDIQFDIHHVPAGGSAYGILKLPTHQLDPDADLFLPKFLDNGKKKADLHATAELTDLQMSAKQHADM